MFSILNNRNTFKQLINNKYMTSIADQIQEQGDGVYRVILNEIRLTKKRMIKNILKLLEKLVFFRNIELITKMPPITKKISALVALVSPLKKGSGYLKPPTDSIVEEIALVFTKNC